MKRVLTLLLLGLALAGTVMAIRQRAVASKGSSSPAAGAVENAATADPALPRDGVVVTYFTSDVRCASCHQIEALTRQSVEKHFAGELAAGKVLFRVVNIDQPENRHFEDDYDLVSKTVVVSRRSGGRESGWTNLQGVWELLGDEAEFDAYVLAGVRRHLDPVP
jgi:hypothetical protein